jgi:hypothetical protein
MVAMQTPVPNDTTALLKRWPRLASYPDMMPTPDAIIFLSTQLSHPDSSGQPGRLAAQDLHLLGLEGAHFLPCPHQQLWAPRQSSLHGSICMGTCFLCKIIRADRRNEGMRWHLYQTLCLHPAALQNVDATLVHEGPGAAHRGLRWQRAWQGLASWVAAEPLPLAPAAHVKQDLRGKCPLQCDN